MTCGQTDRVRSRGVSRVCVGAVESELGQVMLAYTVLFFFLQRL